MKHRRTIGGIIIALLILAIAVYLFTLLPDSSQPENTGFVEPRNDSQDTLPLLAGENAVLVSDQPATMRVMMDIVALADGGYVAVHESEDGKAGTLLGVSKYLTVGEHTDVVVSLRDDENPGAEFVAVLYRDNGDKVFSALADPVVVSENGEPVMMSFVFEEGEE